jgi:hypothetical protein
MRKLSHLTFLFLGTFVGEGSCILLGLYSSSWLPLIGMPFIFILFMCILDLHSIIEEYEIKYKDVEIKEKNKEIS